MPPIHTVNIKSRNVYGNILYYVVSDDACHIARLTGKKTVDIGDVKAFLSLGMAVTIDGLDYYTWKEQA